MTIRAGAAIVDATPPDGLAMAGFAARTSPALGAHDRLTVRAIAINDTAIVCADAIGLHADSSRRIRTRAKLDADRIIVAATHTHGGPVSMPDRVGAPPDFEYLAKLEGACVEALDRALNSQRPARFFHGLGEDPGVARNRRRTDGPVDPQLPMLRIQALDGEWIAVATAYACHPVTLGADNRLWTADYPHFVRTRLEQTHPGAIALFLNGCCGDANMGHSAQASISLAANEDRTFTAAERIGERIAACGLSAPMRSLSSQIAAANSTIDLALTRREADGPTILSARWKKELATAPPARRALLEVWIHWAETIAIAPLSPHRARVTVLNWGGVPIIALPGEIFAETAHTLRSSLSDPQAIVIGFAEDCPGYIPPRSEFPLGGYEIDEAHRYYGMPASFAPGSAEALVEAAVSAARRVGFS